jgi:hypothetical protein
MLGVGEEESEDVALKRAIAEGERMPEIDRAEIFRIIDPA